MPRVWQKYYAGIPIVTEVLDQNDDEILFKSRETYDECVEFICSEILLKFLNPIFLEM